MTRLRFSEAVGWHPLGPVVVVAALVVALSLVVRIDDAGPSLRVWRDRAYQVAARPLPQGIAVVAVALLWWRQVAHLPSWEAAHGL